MHRPEYWDFKPRVEFPKLLWAMRYVSLGWGKETSRVRNTRQHNGAVKPSVGLEVDSPSNSLELFPEEMCISTLKLKYETSHVVSELAHQSHFFISNASSSRQPLCNLEQQPLRLSTATMASKLTPYVFRAAFRPARIASRSQCRAFTASPRAASDALQVVRRPSARSFSRAAVQLLTASILASRYPPEQRQRSLQVHRTEQQAHR
jgi:hypothetical protein